MDKIFEQVLLENNKALAERDARIKELEAELKRLTEEGVISEMLRVNKELWSRIKELEADAEFIKGVIELSQRVEAENIKLNAELSRIKDGVEKLNVLHIGSLSVGKDVVRKSDLDKLMKSGNNVDPTSPLTIGAGVVPLTIGDGISPLTIDERR